MQKFRSFLAKRKEQKQKQERARRQEEELQLLGAETSVALNPRVAELLPQLRK